jgi:deoxyadenosine/deoxycytidine kinase
MNFNNITVVSIDGNIGSGKSTLLEELKIQYKNNPNVIFLKEPVDEWSKITDKKGNTILKKFYSDQLKYGFSFQMMAYVSRLKVIRETLKNHKQNSEKLLVITERNLYTDKMVFAKMLYDSGMIEDINYKIYLNWFDTFIEEFPVHKIIYVKTKPEICHLRITKRSREGETIPLEYLKKCNEYHEEMLDLNSKDKYYDNQLILDGNIDLNEDNTQMEKWIKKIDTFIYYVN